jgi:hypothetical protein
MELQTRAPLYVESSRAGDVMIEIDGDGLVTRVQIEPEVSAEWTADDLAERLYRLYTLALLRARHDHLKRMNAAGADLPPTDNWPSREQVEAYRTRWVTF